ncbi:vitamin K epoxide reductase family protein [Actinomyces minihominis]|uniref:vitamin K epoxide reductase family protein n=1 Tax=Actinomyces minihominis TaxID=2002838 RepID=UPI000C086D97|nr:vitamin K epoxide reductase family protein [Actinomyces minihominis]
MAASSSRASRWTSPGLGLALLAFAILGLLSSGMLIQSELQILQDPEASLICDVNPLIGCSSSLLSPEAHILGLPNAAVGLMAFGALAALAVVLLFRGSLPTVVWWGMVAGAVAGLAFVVFFVYASVSTFQALCPYCMVMWVATLGLLPLVLGGALASGALGEGSEERGRTVLRYSWLIILVLYLVVVLTIVLTMSDKIAQLF